MSKTTYHPERGDLVELNFFPAAGKEIDKRRPAIVLSTRAYNRNAGLCVVVPLTSQAVKGPLWIPMPPGMLPRPSLILCDYVKSLDYRERSIVYLGSVSESLVDQIVGNVLDLLDPIK